MNSNVFSMFDQKQIAEFKEAFSFIDQNADGLVDREDLKEMLTSLGRAPSEAELEDMLAEVPQGANGINFTLFLAMMGDRIQGTDSEVDLLYAFEIIDERRTGFISTDLLRSLMMSIGEPPLSEDEFENVLRGVELDSHGRIDYRHFVKTLTHSANDNDQE